MNRFITVMFLFAVLVCNGQNVLYQDIFTGGVTGGGYNPSWNSNSPGVIQLNIEPGSTIRKAFLLVGMYGEPEPNTMQINGSTVALNSSIGTGNTFLFTLSNYVFSLRTGVVDITNIISSSTLNITPPALQPSVLDGGIYVEFYVVVFYENPILNEVCALIVLNEQDCEGMMDYSITDLNTIDLSNDVGLALHTSHICDTTDDGGYVYIDGTQMGLIGGEDQNTMATCAGVSGTFYYQNNLLYGLSDDVANTTMAGTDAIANIQNYVLDQHAVDIGFQYQSINNPNTPHAPKSNVIWQMFLTYTTPCSSFPTALTVSDTTICEGEPLQLGASGGINYDWLPQTGLSCYDCPNPAFTGDSSTVYTVRIWSTDSCSKVLPVHVKVNPKPKFESIQITSSGCGKSTGSIVAMMDTAQAPYQYTLDNQAPQPDSAFTGLASGNYTLSVENVHGCTNDTLLTVHEELSVTASFIANPATGSAPLWVQTENTSTNATDYLWEWSGGTTTDEHPGFTLDTAGNYTLTLIAYDGAPHCSDTFSLQVLVYDSLQVRIPNVFTPNQDGRNDFFGITTNVSVSGRGALFNRWGNPMHELEFTTQPKIFEPLWDGTDAAEGVYFYQLELTSDTETYSYSGFVQLVR